MATSETANVAASMRVRDRRAERRDADAGERGADDRRRGAAQRHQRRHRGLVAGVDEPRRHRLQRRRVEAVDGRHERGDDEQRGDARLRQQRVAHERERAEQEQRFRPEQEPAPVDGVGDGPAPERRRDERDELHDADQAHRRRRLRQLVHLHRQRHVRHERAEGADPLADEQQAEVAVLAQGGEVEQETSHDSTECGPEKRAAGDQQHQIEQGFEHLCVHPLHDRLADERADHQ